MLSQVEQRLIFNDITGSAAQMPLRYKGTGRNKIVSALHSKLALLLTRSNIKFMCYMYITQLI